MGGRAWPIPKESLTLVPCSWREKITLLPLLYIATFHNECTFVYNQTKKAKKAKKKSRSRPLMQCSSPILSFLRGRANGVPCSAAHHILNPFVQ